MLFLRNTVYVAIICFIVAITARCVANGFHVSPLEINEQVGNLLQDQENIISKESIVGPYTKEMVEPLVFIIMPPKDSNADAVASEKALAKLSSHLELLQQQHVEAQADLEDHEHQLLLAEKTSLAAHKSANEALQHLTSITAALHDSLDVFRHAAESSTLASAKLDQQKSHTERASSWLHSVEFRLQEIVADYMATKKAAKIAVVSAKEAQLIASYGNGSGSDADTIAYISFGQLSSEMDIV